MKNTFWDKRIPTLLSIILIGISIIITSLLVKSGAVFISSADITHAPQNVKITNISNNSFTVSYTTEVENIGSVNFGKDINLGQTVLDDRDQGSGLIRPHKLHTFTLKNLKSKTKYFFTISSGQNTFLNNNIPYEATTAPVPQISTVPQAPIKGKILLPDGATPKEALIYATIEKAQEISSTSYGNGNYLLSLNSLLLKDLSFPLTLDANDIIKIVITNGSLISNVLVSRHQTDIIPVITLSRDYDFIQQTEPILSPSPAISGFQSVVLNLASSSAKSPTISTYPTPTPTVLPTPTIILPTSTPIPTPTPLIIVVPSTMPITPLGNSSILIIGIFFLSIIVFSVIIFTSTQKRILH